MNTVQKKERLTSWMYNVQDRFKDMEVEEIRENLKATSFPVACLMENWQGDFNIGTMIRNANAFNVREVFYIGKKKFDKRGAVGTYHYTDVIYLQSYENLLSLKEKYTFVAVENNFKGDISELHSFEWPENSLICFGEEGLGITNELLDLCDYAVEIPMFGSVRSFNVGSSSAIVLYDYINKLNNK